jgi:hypothetical protein
MEIEMDENHAERSTKEESKESPAKVSKVRKISTLGSKKNAAFRTQARKDTHKHQNARASTSLPC